MAKDKTKEALERYVNAAADLADSVKRNIVHEGIIDDETVLILNKFIIASNAISDLISELAMGDNENDKTLN